jgi:hypothetical protein
MLLDAHTFNKKKSKQASPKRERTRSHPREDEEPPKRATFKKKKPKQASTSRKKSLTLRR